jgi:hypothetical protein
VRERIAVLVAARLKDRETLLSKPAPTSNSSDATSGEFKAKPSGVIVVYTRIPPAKEMVEEIIQYGDVGLKFLTSYLKSNKEGERFIAIEFIGLLGGERIIAPLKEVLQTDASSSIRVFALRWLATAPLDKVLPIISEEAKSNTDEAIRKEAGIVLLRLKGDTSRPDEINFQNVESNSVKPLATPQT